MTEPLTLHSTDADIRAAVEAGSAPATAPEAEAPKPTGPKDLIGPDGKRYTVPEGSVDFALQNGWKTPEQAHEAKVAKHAAYLEENRIEGGIKRFANEAAFGIPELVNTYEHPEQAAIEREAEERFAKAHPIEAYGEKAAGFVAPMLIPGVGAVGKIAEEAVIKGATETLARKVAGSAAKLAAEGAVYSAPQAAVSAAYGDPERAAETMLWGVGLGAALGAGGKLAGAGARAVAEAGTSKIADVLAHKQANGVTVLDDVARNVLGISDKQAQKLGPQRLARIVERADQEGILAMDPKERPEAIKAMFADAGDKIGGHLDKLEGMLDDAKYADLGPKATSVADDFEKVVRERHPEIGTEIHASNHAYWKKLEGAIRAVGDEPSFKDLQTLRNAIREEGKAYVSKSVQARIAQLADATIKKHMEDAAQRVYESGALKEQFADYLAQKERYEAASALTENINPFKGTGRLMRGTGHVGLGSLAHIGIAVAGHPWALANLAREKAMDAFLGNKWGLFGKSVSFLRGVAKDPATAPFIGGFMAKEGASALTAHIEALPEVLSGSKAVARTETDVVQGIIGPTTGLTKQQQYEKLTATINQAAVDQDVTAQRVGHVANTFAGTNVQLASLVAEKKLAAIAYLQSQIPKDPNPPRAFQKNEWKPTPQQQRDFLAKVEVASNPMVVWRHYQEGRLTKVDRDTLMAVYPRIYQEMVGKIVATAHDPKGPKLSADKVAQLDMFTGGALGSARNLPAIQQALASQQQQQQQPGPRPSNRPKLRTPNVGTDTQRRTAGGAVQ